VAGEGVLPPAIQEFVANATKWVAGIDEMMAKDEELLAQIDAIQARAAELGASLDESAAGAAAGAGAGGVEATAAADDELAAAEGRASASAEVWAERSTAAEAAISAQRAAVDELVVASDQLVVASDAAATSIGRASKELDGMAASEDAAGKGAAWGSKIKMAALGVAAGLGYSVIEAAKFQSAFVKLMTQAGVAKSQFSGLRTGVLQLAGQVGFSPSSLSEALFHVESSFESVGITGPKALNLLKTAAEGAATGHANLVDVTNALDATIVSGVPGIHSYNEAMGVLNATVGTGDMTMEDLAKAMSTGVMAVAKSYGQSIYQVGAALAVFGDNNIRGAKAATDLRMAWQAMEAPLKTGDDWLKKIGLTSTQLGSTMEHHGMSQAIQQFVNHLKSSKVPAADWGQYMTNIFGKRAGVGIGILVDQLDRLKGKFPKLKEAAGDFGQGWANTQKTVSQEWNELKSSLDTLVIDFGSELLPAAQKVITVFIKLFQAIGKHQELAAFAGGILAIVGAMKLLSGVQAMLGLVSGAIGKIGMAASESVPEITAMDVALDANVIGVILVAVLALALGLYELYKHCKVVRDALAALGHFLSGAWNAAWAAASRVIHKFVTGALKWVQQQLQMFRAFWARNGAEIKQIATVEWNDLKNIIRVAMAVIRVYIVIALAIIKTAFKVAWDAIRIITTMVFSVIGQVIHMAMTLILGIVQIVLDLIKGHWAAAGHDLVHLTATLWNEVRGITNTILHGLATLVWTLGKDVVMGFAHGIMSAIGAVRSAASAVAHAAEGALKGVLSILSPSKVMMEHGRMTVMGFVQGIVQATPLVDAAMQRLGARASNGLITAGARPGLATAGGTNINVNVNLSGAMAGPQALQGLQQAIQQAVLDYSVKNQGNGLILPARGR
jgi:TP901 family phage tail tape measure protein